MDNYINSALAARGKRDRALRERGLPTPPSTLAVSAFSAIRAWKNAF